MRAVHLFSGIEKGQTDRSVVISHRIGIEQVPANCELFPDKNDHCTNLVIHPWQHTA